MNTSHPKLNTAVSVVASTATSIGVALVLALFLLASGDLFYVKLVQAFPTMREKKRALTTVYGIERRVSVYLLTITVINACLGIVVAFALWMLGLEYAYIWGIAAFLLNFLPILGGRDAAITGIELVKQLNYQNSSVHGIAVVKQFGRECSSNNSTLLLGHEV